MQSDATRWSLRRNPGNAMDHQVLEEIAKTLNADACNYTVFLRYFEMPLQRSARKDIIIKTVLGPDATLGGIQEVEKASVWPNLKDALLYVSDSGAGPAAATMQSERLLALMQVLENEVRNLVDAASSTESFWLQSGHPAYPAFWDFAYLISGKASESILIGSSSD